MKQSMQRFDLREFSSGGSIAQLLDSRAPRFPQRLRGLSGTRWSMLKLSSKNPLAKAMDCSLKRWSTFTRFLDDGRICMTNNAAERAVRGIAVGRRNWTFCGSDAGGERAAVIFTLIETAKLCDIDPKAWLADVLARIADHPASRIHELLPWNWHAAHAQPQAA